jgi:hypothetical protein
MNFIEENEVNGWFGRQLYRLCKEEGLLEVTFTPGVWVIDDYAVFSRLWLRRFVARAQAEDVVTTEEVTNWLADLEQRAENGRYFSALIWFHVVGRKP